MARQTHVTTAAALLKLPDDDWRYELVRGELRRMAPAGSEQGRIAIRLSSSLDQYVFARQLGVVYAAETGFLIASDPDTVRAPAVAFVRRERAEAAGRPVGYWPGAPDLAAEVISSSDLYTDVEERVRDWLTAGIRMVLIINPRHRTVAVHRPLTAVQDLTEADTLDGGSVVAGWTLPLRDLFA